MRIGRIPYINCYPVYGAIDRGIVPLDAELVDGVPTDLNRRMGAGELDISVVSAVEYARDSDRYLLLPERTAPSILAPYHFGHLLIYRISDGATSTIEDFGVIGERAKWIQR